jgi:hypothetical protein
MLLSDLFEATPIEPVQAGPVMAELKQAAITLLVPLISQKVPFITVQQAVEALSAGNNGITITRQMVMDLFNSDQIEAVKRIEGDRIWLQYPDDEDHGETQTKSSEDKVADLAANEINKDLGSDKPGA